MAGVEEQHYQPYLAATTGAASRRTAPARHCTHGDSMVRWREQAATLTSAKGKPGMFIRGPLAMIAASWLACLTDPPVLPQAPSSTRMHYK